MGKERCNVERLKTDIKSIKLIDVEYKEFDKANYFKLIYSLKKFGQIRPINVVSIDNTLYCFEGRKILTTMEGLNLTEVEINLWDVDLKDRLNIQLIINDLSFETNDIKLSEVCNQIKDLDVGKLPFTKEIFEDYIKLINFDWLEYERSEETQLGLFE